MPKDVWLSSSLDLDPCDYWLWNEVEKVSINNVTLALGLLKSAIKRGFRSINREHAMNGYESFRRRIQKLLMLEGSILNKKLLWRL